MKKAHLAFLAVAVSALLAVPLQAGVKVTVAPEPVEKQVALRAPDGKYVSTQSPGGLLNVEGAKIGSKQVFTLVDLSGGMLADGHDVKIKYIPSSKNGGGDPSKASYWREVPEGIKRGSAGSVFKVKAVETKYSFQAPSGKFVTGTVTENGLKVSDKEADALVLEIVDLSAGIPKTPKAPKPATTNAPAIPAPDEPASPTADKPAAPTTEKPAAE